MIPDPHVRFGLATRQLEILTPIQVDSHADEGTEQGTDQSDQIVEEWDCFSDEEGNDTVEQHA